MIHQLYNKSLELHFDEASHVYTVDGQVVPSVTGIMEATSGKFGIGAGWSAKMCGEFLAARFPKDVDKLVTFEAENMSLIVDEIELNDFIKSMKGHWRRTSNKAADIGTMVHKYAEDYLAGKKPKRPSNKMAKNAVEAFHDWIASHDIEVIASEQKVYSKLYQYAGTLDLDAVIDGKRTIADFKSSKAIYPEMFIQCGGYAVAREEELNQSLSDPIYEACCIIQFSKDGKGFNVKWSDDFEKDQAAFLSAKHYFDRVNQLTSMLKGK